MDIPGVTIYENFHVLVSAFVSPGSRLGGRVRTGGGEIESMSQPSALSIDRTCDQVMLELLKQNF